MKKILTLALASALAAMTLDAKCGSDDDRWFTPLEIALFSPLQLPFYDRDVYGIRLDLVYGSAYDVYGLDLGVVNANYGYVGGIQAGAFNWVDGVIGGIEAGVLANVSTRGAFGIQLAGVANVGQGDFGGIQAALANNFNYFYGVQFAGLFNRTDNESYGLSVAAVCNYSRCEHNGVELGVFNLSEGLSGAQIGLFNCVFGRAEGLQIGLMNGAKRLRGVQIGLVNLIETGLFTIMPVLNANF